MKHVGCQSLNACFVCEHCGEHIGKLEGSFRDHCPHCLTSKHLDNVPGDRANGCKGLLVPVMYSWKKVRWETGRSVGWS